MSKVVTIPKDRNPFVVIVNGVKYSYPAGVTTEVPDEVADVIEKYVGAKPKPDPNAGINFGGAQSDWNQTDSSAADFVKNKTHYYSKKIFFNEASVPVNDGTVMFETDGVPSVGASMNFTFNEVEYVVDVFDYSGIATFGDLSLLGIGESNGLPFVGFWQVGTTCMLFLQFGGMASCSIKMVGQLAVKMPTEFYDRSTVFFTNMGPWIYKDSSLTQKATIQDVMKAINNGPVMINASGQIFYQPSEFWTSVGYEENGIQHNCLCCKIAKNFDKNGPTDYAVLHTAEYTPET